MTRAEFVKQAFNAVFVTGFAMLAAQYLKVTPLIASSLTLSGVLIFIGVFISLYLVRRVSLVVISRFRIWRDGLSKDGAERLRKIGSITFAVYWLFFGAYLYRLYTNELYTELVSVATALMVFLVILIGERLSSDGRA